MVEMELNEMVDMLVTGKHYLSKIGRKKEGKMSQMQCPQCDFKQAAYLPLSVMEEHIEKCHPYWLG